MKNTVSNEMPKNEERTYLLSGLKRPCTTLTTRSYCTLIGIRLVSLKLGGMELTIVMALVELEPVSSACIVDVDLRVVLPSEPRDGEKILDHLGFLPLSDGPPPELDCIVGSTVASAVESPAVPAFPRVFSSRGTAICPFPVIKAADFVDVSKWAGNGKENGNVYCPINLLSDLAFAVPLGCGEVEPRGSPDNLFHRRNS